MLGAMVAAVARRRTRRDEDWLIVSVSDHGGRWFGHGADDDANRLVHLVVAGDGVAPGPIAPAPSVADVAVTALVHLGAVVDPAWGLEGVARGGSAVNRGRGRGA
jgi:hypothetical protein